MVPVNISVTAWLTSSLTGSGWKPLPLPLLALSVFSGPWRLLRMFTNLRQYRLEIAGQKQAANMCIFRVPHLNVRFSRVNTNIQVVLKMCPFF